MKKINLMVGLVILIVGFGILITQSAFKKYKLKNEKYTTYTFYYDGPNFEVENVEKESNWHYDAAGNTCSGDNRQACTIRISGDYVDNPLTAPALKTSANLSATLNSIFNTAYVTGSDDPSMEIFNAKNQ